MRYEKEITFPRRNFSVSVNTAKELISSEKVSLDHVLFDGKGFTHAFGTAFFGEIPSGCERLYAVRGELYAYNAGDTRLFRLGDGKFWDGIRDEPSMLLPTKFYSKDEEGIWVIGPSRLSLLHGNAASHYSLRQGGAAAVLHKERVCFIEGQKLYYSQAYEQGPFENADSDPNGYGYVELLRPEAGNFVGMAVYDDELFLFRERGIDKFLMDYEVLNHKAYPVPYGGKDIVGRSVVSCGDKVRFLAADGLYEFDGSTAKRVETELAKRVDFSDPTRFEAGVWGDLYALSFPEKGGGKALFLYDPKREYGFEMGVAADSFACASDEAYFRVGKAIYRLTDSAPLETASALSFDVPTGAGEVIWIAVRGEGKTAAELSLGGETRTIFLDGEKKAFLPRPLVGGGTLAVKLSSNDEKWRVESVCIGYAEVAS